MGICDKYRAEWFQIEIIHKILKSLFVLVWNLISCRYDTFTFTFTLLRIMIER